MSLQATYHFHEIEVVEPEFSRVYFELFKKLDYAGYRDQIIKGIKNQLRDLILSGKETGVRIEPETDIYNPLKKVGYPSDGVVYILRDLGVGGEKYLDNYGNDASLTLTPKGKKWAMDVPDVSQAVSSGRILNYFDTPDGASHKLKVLLREVNNLPEIDSFANLIGHQLRTILNLLLNHINKNLLRTSVPVDKQGLRKLIDFTIGGCAKAGLGNLATNLEELKNSKYKDIIDDLIHDDHTTANPRIIENMMTHIKHILSLAYR